MSEQLDLVAGHKRTVGTRDPDDFYQSPAWLARLLAEKAHLRRSCFRGILDAGAGTGVLGMAAETLSKESFQIVDPRSQLPTMTTVEIDQGRSDLQPAHWDRWCCTLEDAAKMCAWRTFDLVVTNPPFKGWQAWVETCKGLVESCNGVLAVIGFANVLGGQARAPWWTADPPTQVWMVPRRPQFTVAKGTDSRDTILVIWESGLEPLPFGWVPPEECR